MTTWNSDCCGRAAMTLFIALQFVACSEKASVQETFPLSDGVVVAVDSRGTAELSVNGRPLWAMSPSATPVVETFNETSVGAFAIYNFTRNDRKRILLERFTGATQTDNVVTLSYASDDDDHAAEIVIRPDPDGANATRVTLGLTRGSADSLALPTRCDTDGTFFGFGEQYNSTEQKGEAFDLIVSEQGIGRDGLARVFTGDAHTTYFPMPYYVDARGFGVLVNTDNRVVVDLCTEPDGKEADKSGDTAWLEVTHDDALDLTVFHGPTPKDVIAQLGDRVGRPKLPPPWAWSLWISKQGGQAAVEAEVVALESAQIPVAVIWSQDWSGHRFNADSSAGVQYRWEVDLERYPDLGGLIRGLHDRDIKFLAYTNPFVDLKLPNHFAEMAEAGLLIKREDGSVYEHSMPAGRGSQPDLTNPATRAYVHEALAAMVNDYGIDGWMSDFGEWMPLDAVVADGTDANAYHNRFPLDWSRAQYDALNSARPDGDYVVFARAGWTGVHATSMIYWPGDLQSSFSKTDGLPTVPIAMINLGLAGIPYVTHDIGGYHVDGEPRSKELWLRWAELGAFSPIMRTHEGALLAENWDWDRDSDTIAAFRRLVLIHEALGPELIELATEAQVTSVPMVRHLMLEYPDDPATYEIDDQFLLGPNLLVAPVTTEGATSREVYLPAGTWFDVWTGQAYDGNQAVTFAAPLGQPPVLSRGVDRSDLRSIERE